MLTVRKACGRLTLRTLVSCGRLRQGLCPIKKNVSPAHCKLVCMRIVRFPALAAAYSVVLRTPPSGAAPHKKRMVIGPLHVNLHGPLTILFFRGLSLKCKKTPRCPILPGSCPPSTFSAEGLYFCVRYVNRCFPFAIITRSILRFYSVFGHSKQHKGKEFFKMS